MLYFPAEIVSEYLKQDYIDDGEKLQFIYIDKLVIYLKQRSQSILIYFIYTRRDVLKATSKIGNYSFQSQKDIQRYTNKVYHSKQLQPFSYPKYNRLGCKETLDQIADLRKQSSHIYKYYTPRGLALYRRILGYQTFENTITLREHYRLLPSHFPTLNVAAQAYQTTYDRGDQRKSHQPQVPTLLRSKLSNKTRVITI